ncbi:MAG: hypothetical protein K2X09_05675 [Rickettsiales bacterium]|nr:hypothetical protein [Rickettsiales bacterium]
MKPYYFRGLVIQAHPFEEPAGTWWPNATITDPATDEPSSVSLREPETSELKAAIAAVREARRGILNNFWRN